MAAKRNKPDAEETLEENLAALEEILEKLEKDSLTLDETFTLYQNGMSRLQKCNQQMDRVEKQLEILEEEGWSVDDGNDTI